MRELTLYLQSIVNGIRFNLPLCRETLHRFLSEYLQRIRDLEDKTEIQRRQIKDLEEKVGHVGRPSAAA